MVDFTALTQKLAEIQEKISSLVNKINAASGGESFYARFVLKDNRYLIGLVSNLRMNQYKILFDFTEEGVINEKIARLKTSKEIKFEELKGIVVFKTLSGKPMFIGESYEEGGEKI